MFKKITWLSSTSWTYDAPKVLILYLKNKKHNTSGTKTKINILVCDNHKSKNAKKHIVRATKSGTQIFSAVEYV